ncbi:MAG: hypothetical protein Q7S40_21995 [Opitutaceae bacterium]|nr:hypothetical protein [Opitutaceae bacterium]
MNTWLHPCSREREPGRAPRRIRIDALEVEPLDPKRLNARANARQRVEDNAFHLSAVRIWEADRGSTAGTRLRAPRRSRRLAAIAAIVTSVAAGAAPPIADYTIQLDVIREGYDGVHCWVHPRAGIVPASNGAAPSVVLTLQKLWLRGSDVFGPLHELRTDDLGRTWNGPVEHAATLGQRAEPNGVTVGACDFWPKWHAASGRLLGIGHTVRYRDNAVIRERPRETYFSIYDPAARTWTACRTLAMPDEPRFYNAGAGCAQRVDLPGGDILLPFYFKARGASDYRVAVARCAFDGSTLSVRTVGPELALAGGRGLYEPSLAHVGGRFFLTLRNDQAAYVATSRDGLNFDAPRRWTCDDGTDLGSYNTQAHWVTHGDALFLVYTRRGAGNDHVTRHRAPLFIAQIDPERLVVLRATERILVPEHGARLGNFGITEITASETWVTVAEWMQGNPPMRIIPPDNPWGANNRVYAARIRFDRPLPPAAAMRAAARERPRRLLFNDDGGETRVPPRPLPKPADFLPARIAPLAGTQVDTIVFDTTSGTFNRFAHRTQVAEMFFQREGRYQHNILPDLAPLGTDSLRVVTEHCRKVGHEVFWTMRMNDTHDASNPLLIPKLKAAHPDWLMGTKEKPPKRGTWSAVDYARPEIRDLARRTIAEVAANFDIDGIELDFWRHPVFFRQTAAELPVGDEERALMTALLRDIRRDLDAAARRRGHAILLAIKTPDSVSYCRELGLDLEHWLADGLVDFLVPGGYFQLNHWTESVALARRHGVKIYACLPESRVRDEAGKRERASLETLRGRALAAWAAGVDGIEMFNHSNPQSPLWRELGDPALLRTLPKIYFASVQGASNSRSYYPAQKHTVVPTLTPDAPAKLAANEARTIEVLIGDDLRTTERLGARLTLRVARTDAAPRVEWDGVPIALAAVDAHTWSGAIERARVTPGVRRIAIRAARTMELQDLAVRIEAAP